MAQIAYSFEEVCLTLGKDKSGKRQSIALITGIATIETSGRGRDTEWEIVSIEIECPIISSWCASETTIEPGNPLFDFVTESIEWDCGDKIWDECNEASMSDPDHAREERAECRYQQMREERLGQS